MKVIPAVDLLDGKAVQLRGGNPDHRIWEDDDPVAVAEGWWEKGAEHLHVVDLGNALDLGDNWGIIEEILEKSPVPVTVGGGLRTTNQLRDILSVGEDNMAVVSTRAWRDPLWLDHIVDAWPGRIVVGLELKRGTIAVEGWTQRLKLTLEEGIFRLDDLDLGGVLFTDIDREGRMVGPNIDTCQQACENLDVPVIVSGGISTLEHLQAMREAGAWGVVIGTALYTGDLELEEAMSTLEA